MNTSLFARWELTGPALSFGLAPQVPTGSGEFSGPALDSRLEWKLAGRGDVLTLEVAAADVPESLAEGLSLYHHIAEAVANQIPAESVIRCVGGVRLGLPGGALTGADVRRLAELAAPVLAPWLSRAAAGDARLLPHGAALEIEFGRRPVPEAFDLLVQGVTALVPALLESERWSGAPAASAAPGAATVAEVHAGGEVPGTAELWKSVAPGLAPVLGKAVYETLGRWIDVSWAPTRRAATSKRAEAESSVVVAEAPRGEFGSGLRAIPFRSGGRPLDELEEAGTGCSEAGGFVRSGREGVGEDAIWLVFQLTDLDDVPRGADLRVRASAWFLSHDAEATDPTASDRAMPVPNFSRVPVEPRRVAALGPDGPLLETVSFVAGTSAGYVFPIVPQLAFMPSAHEDGWTWADAPPALRASVPDGTDPYTFGCFFHQRVLVELTLSVAGKDVACSRSILTVYDLDRFGSLYGRLLDLVSQDTAGQASELGESEIYAGHHPWYPVLGIGMNKASFYMRAIIDDSRTQSCHLAHPWWLLDVGLWLEYLTCVGVFAAVRASYPELLSQTEWELVETSPRFKEVRERIHPQRWSEVWATRNILGKGRSPLAAGPVGFLNLIRKQRGTLEFLEAHHEDLVHAVELAGPNLQSAQEAWHRVYRDAERAVANSSLAAFPELRHVPAAYRDFALWHEKGDFAKLPGGFLLPKSIAGALGDQDGIYPSAARQYRESMNHVAGVCRERGLMEHAGEESVPREVSLIEALIDGDEQRFKVLQARDGYGGSLTATSQTLAVRVTPGRRSIRELLRVHPLFESMDEGELENLANVARVAHAVPTEPIVTQGEPGNSMFLLESGRVDVEVEGRDGNPRVVRTMVPGEYFGEMAMLTGEARSATVRAQDYPTLVELSSEHIRPLIEARFEILESMSETAATRAVQRQRGSDGGSAVSRREVARQMRIHILGEAHADQLERNATVLQESVIQLLHRLPLLAPLSQEERIALAERAEPRTVAGGTVIVRQGTRGTSLFAVLAGQVGVYLNQRGRRRQIATIRDGEVFGEMALMTGERRSADVQADGDCTVVEISRSDFLPVMTRRPALVVALSDILEQRAAERRALDASAATRTGLRERARSFFFG